MPVPEAWPHRLGQRLVAEKPANLRGDCPSLETALRRSQRDWCPGHSPTPGQGEQRAGQMQESDSLLTGLMELEVNFDLKSKDHHKVLSIAQPAKLVMSITFGESGHWFLLHHHQKYKYS